MAFPTVQGRNTSKNGSAVADQVVSLPTGIQSGELLIAVISYGVTGNSFTWPAGWTQMGAVQEQATGATQGVVAAYRKADGTEGSTITVTASVATRSVHRTWRISGAEDPATQAPERSGANGTNSSADPPSLTPTGGSKDYLWLAIGTNSHSTVYTGFPASYTDTFTDNSSTGTTAHCVIGTAERALAAASEDPGAYSGADAAAEWAAMTIAVHPATAVVQPPRYGFVNHGHPGVL